MWGKADDLRLSVLMGLPKGLRLVHEMRRALTDDQQHKVDDAIVEHLETDNWKKRARSGTRGTWARVDGEVHFQISHVGVCVMAAVDDLANGTVRIILTGGTGVGSGFHFLEPEIIVSNAHVVEHLITSATPMSAVAEDGRQWSLKVLGFSSPQEHDYAIMEASGAEFRGRAFLIPDTSAITRGRPILYSGYPHGLPPLLTFHSEIGAPLTGRQFFFDGMIHGGNSGGPITDEGGKALLGIVTARRFLGDPEMQKVDKEMGDLIAYLDKIKSQGSVSIMGINFTEFASAVSQIALLTNELIRRNSTTGIGIGIHTKELLEKARELKLL